MGLNILFPHNSMLATLEARFLACQGQKWKSKMSEMHEFTLMPISSGAVEGKKKKRLTLI